MEEELNQTKNQEPEEQARTIPKFCPVDGSLMYKGDVQGVLCWLCPDCDYTEPV